MFFINKNVLHLSIQLKKKISDEQHQTFPIHEHSTVQGVVLLNYPCSGWERVEPGHYGRPSIKMYNLEFLNLTMLKVDGNVDF
jgi:hypothetical protein